MTKKQRELLNFIQHFIREHGYSPSFREIMSGLDYKSVSTVAIHVNNLITLGHLRKKDNSARSLEVVGQNTSKVTEETIKPSQQKWLVDIISSRFKKLDGSSDKKQIDELFILVGALSIVGGKDAAAHYKQKLKKYL